MKKILFAVLAASFLSASFADDTNQQKSIKDTQRKQTSVQRTNSHRTTIGLPEIPLFPSQTIPEHFYTGTMTIKDGDKILVKTEISTSEKSPVPSFIGEETTYIKSLKKHTSEKGGTIAVAEPGTIRTGLGFFFTPSFVDETHTRVKFSIEESRVNSIDKFTYDGEELQLPSFSFLSVEQDIVLKNGEPLTIPFGKNHSDSLLNPSSGGRTLSIEVRRVDPKNGN